MVTGLVGWRNATYTANVDFSKALGSLCVAVMEKCVLRGDVVR